jgi:hypothetical protein
MLNIYLSGAFIAILAIVLYVRVCSIESQYYTAVQPFLSLHSKERPVSIYIYLLIEK